jgi:pimeloyl-ACP methyl ester carboxylesterase
MKRTLRSSLCRVTVLVSLALLVSSCRAVVGSLAMPFLYEDVAHAVAWVRSHIGEHGGDPNSVFLMGHSAGAQLASYVALDGETAARFGVGTLCGLIPASGAGFDLADDETYALGATRSYYERRFRIADEDWVREGVAGPSVVEFVSDTRCEATKRG